MARFMRSYGKSTLGKPIVVGAATAPFVARPIGVHLVRSPRVAAPDSNSRFTKPAVVGPGIAYHGPGVRLAGPVNARARVESRLFPPTAVTQAVTFVALPVTVKLAYSRRGAPKPRLFPPVIPPVARPVAVALTRNRVQRTTGHLFGPAVVGAGIVSRPVKVTLSPSKRGTPKPRLFPPTVVNPAAALARPVFARFAPQRRGRAKSTIFAPIIPPLAPPVRVALVRVRVPRTFTHLSGPTAVGAGIFFRPVKVTFTPQKRGVPKSRLFPPTAVNPVVALAYPTLVRLAPSRRGRARSFLSPPVIPPLASPLRVALVRLRVPRTITRLFRPVVVGGGIYFRPVKVTLAPSKRGSAKPLLRPPIIPPLAPPIEAKFVTEFVSVELRPRAAHSHLGAPAVVGAGITFRPVFVKLAPSRRGTPKSRLAPPTVVNAAPSIVYPPVLVKLARSRRGAPKSRLSPPVIPPLATPIRTTLTRVVVRAYRSHLFGPVAVGAGIVFSPVKVVVVRGRAGKPRSILRTPTVVTPVVSLAQPISVSLTYSRRGAAKPRLSPSAVVGAGIAFSGPRVRLVNPINRRATVEYVLSPPTVLASVAVVYPITVKLARSRRGVAKSRLSKPIIPPLAAPVRITLAKGRVGKAKPLSIIPVVVGAGITFPAVSVTLAPQRRGKPKSHLFPPVIPPLAAPVRVAIARIRPARTNPRLGPPVAVGAGIVSPPLQTTLAPQRRGTPKSKLAPPTVVTAAAVYPPVAVKLSHPRVRVATHSALRGPTVVFGQTTLQFGPPVSLVRSPHPITKSFLRPPVTVTAAVAVVYPPVRVVLARTRRVTTKSRLTPPVFVPAAAPTRVTLAKRYRSKQFSRLGAPVAVGAGITFRPVKTTLTRIKPPKRFSHLSPPTAVIPATQIYFGPTVKVTYSRRGKPTSRLASPTVVGAGIYFRPVKVTIAPSRRPRTTSKLRPPIVPPLAPATSTTLARVRPVATRHALRTPTVVGRTPFRPIETTLARIRPVRTRSLLRGPTAVLVFVALPINVTLTTVDLRRRRPTHRIAPPTVLGSAGTVNVTLTRIRPPQRFSRLAPPAVVGAGIVFAPVSVTLVLIKPVPTRTRLFPPTVVVTVTPGFTCGYPIGQGAAESSSIGGSAGESSDVGQGAEGSDVAGGASNIQSVGGSAAEITDQNGGVPT